MTYSIVARDPETGELGVAVQSHWFSVGSVVVAAEAGVGAIATQATPNLGYKSDGLRMLREGRTAAETSLALRAADPDAPHRQFAVVDVRGDAVPFTGEACIRHAGHRTGVGYSCQANMMRNDTVGAAMAAAFESATGPLAWRLLAALDAAEDAGGDLRGRQSAAVLVVPATGGPDDKVVDIRVEDHPEPLTELRRLLALGDAYALADAADADVARGDFTAAAERYVTAHELAPANDELRFWAGLGLIDAGATDRGIGLVRASIRSDPSWHELLRRADPVTIPSSAVALAMLEEEE